MTWLEDPVAARKIVDGIEQSQPGFVPEPPAARRGYRWIYQIFGLGAAERIAACKRRLVGGATNC
jgi:hypothetical protein